MAPSPRPVLLAVAGLCKMPGVWAHMGTTRQKRWDVPGGVSTGLPSQGLAARLTEDAPQAPLQRAANKQLKD